MESIPPRGVLGERADAPLLTERAPSCVARTFRILNLVACLCTRRLQRVRNSALEMRVKLVKLHVR